MVRPLPPFPAFREDTLEKARNAGFRGKWFPTAVMDAERGYLIYQINDADSLAKRATTLAALIISQKARLIGLVWQQDETLHTFVASPNKSEHWEAPILGRRRGDVGEWEQADTPGPMAQAARIALTKVNPEAALPEMAR